MNAVIFETGRFLVESKNSIEGVDSGKVHCIAGILLQTFYQKTLAIHVCLSQTQTCEMDPEDFTNISPDMSG